MAFTLEALHFSGPTDRVGYKSQDRFGSWIQELLGPLHATIDLLESQFDVATGDRQPRSTLPIGLHARTLILQIAQKFGNDCCR